MISNHWIELEETLGKSFQCSLFADKKPSLLLPCPQPTSKVFCFTYWTSSWFKGMQGSWVSCHLINTVQPVRASLALLKKRELETERKKSIFRRVGKVFFFLSSWQYLNVIQLHQNHPVLFPIQHNVSTRTHTAAPPSPLPIHYTLSAQKHSGVHFHPQRLHIPRALTNTSFFTLSLPGNVIKHETSQIIFVLCTNLKHPILLTWLLLWSLSSDSFPI